MRIDQYQSRTTCGFTIVACEVAEQFGPTHFVNRCVRGSSSTRSGSPHGYFVQSIQLVEIMTYKSRKILMSFNLRNRSLLKVEDYTQREFQYLLDLAGDLKRAKYSRTEQPHLSGREIVLIFEKTSTRTRCAFEVACHDQGAHVTYLDPSGSQIGHKESFKDTARVLGRMFDAIEYRGRPRPVWRNSPDTPAFRSITA
jgi:hypothetical protein